MSTKSITLLSIAWSLLVVGCTLFKVAEENTGTELTQEILTNELLESKKRVKIITNEIYNGKYNGDLPIDEAIKIISKEIEIQKIIYQKYNQLPKEHKTDKRIYLQFFQLGKYGWAPEKSILNALKNETQ